MFHPRNFFIVCSFEVVVFRFKTRGIFDILNRLKKYRVALDFQKSELIRLIEVFELLYFSLEESFEEYLDCQEFFETNQISILEIISRHLFDHIAFLFSVLLFLLKDIFFFDNPTHVRKSVHSELLQILNLSLGFFQTCSTHLSKFF